MDFLNDTLKTYALPEAGKGSFNTASLTSPRFN